MLFFCSPPRSSRVDLVEKMPPPPPTQAQRRLLTKKLYTSGGHCVNPTVLCGFCISASELPSVRAPPRNRKSTHTANDLGPPLVVCACVWGPGAGSCGLQRDRVCPPRRSRRRSVGATPYGTRSTTDTTRRTQHGGTRSEPSMPWRFVRTTTPPSPALKLKRRQLCFCLLRRVGEASFLVPHRLVPGGCSTARPPPPSRPLDRRPVAPRRGCTRERPKERDRARRRRCRLPTTGQLR